MGYPERPPNSLALGGTGCCRNCDGRRTGHGQSSRPHEGITEVLFGIGLTVVEVSVVLLLEWYALGLRASEDEWKSRHDIELVATATADTARSEHSRRVEHLQKINKGIVTPEKSLT